MTHDPHRLATAEQIVNGNNPFEKVDTPLGTMERWRAEAMLIGTTSGALHVLQSIRNDAASEIARADADQARTALIQHLCAKVDAFQSKLDNLVAQVAAERAARRADAARQKKLDEEEITLPPDLGETPPSRATADEGHQPSGDLHEIAAKEDGEGDLPEELREGVPSTTGNYPNPELPQPPVVSQPISVSLNQE